MAEITILVFDDDESSQRALKSMLDSEGWRVRVVPLLRDAMNELAHGTWSMVIANLSLTGIDGPEFTVLSDLASAPPVQDGKSTPMPWRTNRSGAMPRSTSAWRSPSVCTNSRSAARAICINGGLK